MEMEKLEKTKKWLKLNQLLNNLENLENFDSIISIISDPKNESWKYIEPTKNESILHKIIKQDFFELAQNIINIIKKITTLEEFLNFINHQNDKGINILHLACYKGNMNLIKFLLENGIDYHAKGKTGLSCIHFGAQINSVTVIYYFITKYNFNIYEEDNNGNNFYHWACFCSSEKVIDFFLNDKNFEINTKNREGYIPLHYYLASKNERSIKRLIFRGADPYLRNNKGENAFDLLNKNKDIVNKNQIKEVLERKYYTKTPFFIFIFYHFVYIYFIIIFQFPFINIKRITLLYRIYLFWSGFVLTYIIYFLYKSPGTIKPNKNNFLLNLIENDKENNIDLWYYCIKCQIKTEFNSKHCYVCDKCVKDFDHHCIWLKKCIGKDNKTAFYFLLLIILLNSIFNLIICFLSEINDVIKTQFIFTQFLMNHLRFTRIIKASVFALYFLFSFFVFFIIIPVIKNYLRQRKSDDIFEGAKIVKLIENTNEGDNDEKDKLIKK